MTVEWWYTWEQGGYIYVADNNAIIWGIAGPL
jgi:hypothetical protein